MGGLAGAGIGGMLFGDGFGGMWGGGGMGFAGGLGLLLQVALIGAAAWWLYSIFRNRGNAPQLYTPGAYARDAYAKPAYPIGGQARGVNDTVPTSGGFSGRSHDEIGVTELT
jgi:predicted lipid-binding transport protein (Tim44 family)